MEIRKTNPTSEARSCKTNKKIKKIKKSDIRHKYIN